MFKMDCQVLLCLSCNEELSKGCCHIVHMCYTTLAVEEQPECPFSKASRGSNS